MPVDDPQGRGHRPAQGRRAPGSKGARSPRSSTKTPSNPGRRRRIVFDPAGINLYADSWRIEMAGLTMDKTWNNKAWFMVLPVLVLVAFSRSSR